LENAEFALGTEILIGEEARGIAGQPSSAQSVRSPARSPVFVTEINLPNEHEAGPGVKNFASCSVFLQSVGTSRSSRRQDEP
jgi:hypothetical protein